MRDALAAEGRFDTPEALRLFLAADQVRPGNPKILQKIARQYSDSEIDARTPEEKLRIMQLALDYSKRAEALDPKNPVNVLSVAICYGKLATQGDISTRVKYSRLVKQEAERAVVLAPKTPAHHVELGFALLAVGRPADARAAFNRGLALPSLEKHDDAAKAEARKALAGLKP